MDTFTNGQILVIAPTDKQIDVMNSERFGQELNDLFDGEHDVIMDLKNVIFLDSSALGKLVLFLRKIRESRRNLVFCNMTDAVAVLFRMVRLAQIATTVPTLSEAFESLGAKAQ